MFGVKDSEMMARWVQLGCFSPINRLHSTDSVFNSKEPWRYSRDARATMEAHLRLRHRLVPYLYTWARLAHTQGVGPVRPVYHDFPCEMGAYVSRNEFLFGDLLVVPVVHQADAATHLARESAWLPEGTWFDLPTGRRYEAGAGGTMTSLSRTLDQIPVLARAGSLVTVAEDLSEPAGQNPRHLGVIVVPGADGEFVLEEDDASAEPGQDGVVRTRFALTWDEEAATARLEVTQEGADSVAPAERELTLHLLSVGGQVSASVAGRPVEVTEREADGFTLAGGLDVHVGTVRPGEGVVVELAGVRTEPASLAGEVFAILEPAELEYQVKDRAWQIVTSGARGGALLSGLRAVGLPEEILTAVAEVA